MLTLHSVELINFETTILLDLDKQASQLKHFCLHNVHINNIDDDNNDYSIKSNWSIMIGYYR